MGKAQSPKKGLVCEFSGPGSFGPYDSWAKIRKFAGKARKFVSKARKLVAFLVPAEKLKPAVWNIFPCISFLSWGFLGGWVFP